MEYICVNGGVPLHGEITVQSSKNATLPIMAAALLAKGTTVLKKCPPISDVYHMADMMEEIGCRIWWEEDSLCIDTTGVKTFDIGSGKTGNMRASCLFLGSLLGRFHQAVIGYPGGCVIGKRPIDMHINGMKQMGVSFEELDDGIRARTRAIKGTTIQLPYPSVGATENLMMAAATADGITEICGCAKEPEVVELSYFLNAMGGRVQWTPMGTLRIEGVERLHGVEYTMVPDRIVAGTYLLAAVATRSKIMLNHVPWQHMESLKQLLGKMGAVIEVTGDRTIFDGSEAVKGIDYVRTMPYPGFPTDLQSQLAAVLAIADGESVMEETVFESRFAAIEQLKRMQADIQVEDGKLKIRPVKKLHGARVQAGDLRGGAALVIAALAAEGETQIGGCHYLERGYTDIVRDLRTLGADISKKYT